MEPGLAGGRWPRCVTSATSAAVGTLTGAHLLPLAGQEGPGLDEVPGDGAVVVEAAAPAQLDAGVADVPHHHPPGRAWRSWGDGKCVTEMEDPEV